MTTTVETTSSGLNSQQTNVNVSQTNNNNDGKMIGVRLVYGNKKKARYWPHKITTELLSTNVTTTFPELKNCKFHVEFDNGTYIEDGVDWDSALKFYLSQEKHINDEKQKLLHSHRLELTVVNDSAPKKNRKVNNNGINLPPHKKRKLDNGTYVGIHNNNNNNNTKTITNKTPNNTSNNKNNKNNTTTSTNVSKNGYNPNEDQSDDDEEDEEEEMDIQANTRKSTINRQPMMTPRTMMSTTMMRPNQLTYTTQYQTTMPMRTQPTTTYYSTQPRYYYSQPQTYGTTLGTTGTYQYRTTQPMNTVQPSSYYVNIPTYNTVPAPITRNKRKNNKEYIKGVWEEIYSIMCKTKEPMNVLWIRKEMKGLRCDKPPIKTLNYVMYRKHEIGYLNKIEAHPNSKCQKPKWELKEYPQEQPPNAPGESQSGEVPPPPPPGSTEQQQQQQPQSQEAPQEIEIIDDSEPQTQQETQQVSQPTSEEQTQQTVQPQPTTSQMAGQTQPTQPTQPEPTIIDLS